jgi:hypothetical protein
MKVVVWKYVYFIVGSLTLCSLTQCRPLFSSVSEKPKQEMERPISKRDMPERAIQLLEPFLENTRQVKFYQESDGEQTSYEAKFLWQQKTLSIEFFNNGKLMDIEQLITFEEVEASAIKEIASYFKNNFSRHKITKTQRQFTAEKRRDNSEEVIEEFLDNDWEDLTIRYEIIARVKGSDMFGAYEFLFDQEGKLMQKRAINRRSADNILY